MRGDPVSDGELCHLYDRILTGLPVSFSVSSEKLGISVMTNADPKSEKNR
jgi:hypothetical protein